jgi:hypothetical protein
MTFRIKVNGIVFDVLYLDKNDQLTVHSHDAKLFEDEHIASIYLNKFLEGFNDSDKKRFSIENHHCLG